MTPRPSEPNKQNKPEGAQDLTKESFKLPADIEAMRVKVADAVSVLLQPGHLELLSPEKRAALTSALVGPAAGTQTGLTVGSSTAPIRTEENLARRNELVRLLGDVPDIETARQQLRQLKDVLAERGERVCCPACQKPGYFQVRAAGRLNPVTGKREQIQFVGRHGFGSGRTEHGSWRGIPGDVKFESSEG